MLNVKLSIIVPIFKAELYVEKCARSLMEQTMKDGIEFIFVNDCTPDNSMQILERVLADYPERTSQVIIVNNLENVGVCESRRRGLEHAKGLYIGWCDSDDWCDKNMFETMCLVAESRSLDIVVCNYWEFSNGVNRLIVIDHSNNPQEAIANPRKCRSFSGVLWNQIIKKELYDKCWNSIVPTDYSEDTYILFHIYYYAKTLEIVDKPLCFYRTDNEHSLVHVRDDSKDAWLIQQENLERVERLYYQDDGWARFHVAINAFIFERKCLYKGAFASNKEFFNTCRYASRDILRFYDWRKLSNWKIYLANNLFFIYRLVNYN